MVWGAPTSRSSGGRSAVQTSSGTPARWASTTAGCSSAAAVPLVVSTHGRAAGGQPEAEGRGTRRSARRGARGPAHRRRSASARPAASTGSPGQTTASVTPARTHSSTSVAQNVAARRHGIGGYRRAPRVHGERDGAGPRSCCSTASPRPRRCWGPLAPALARRPRRSCGSTRPATAARPATARRPARDRPADGRGRRPGRVPRLLDGRADGAARGAWPGPSVVEPLVLSAPPRASRTPPSGRRGAPPTGAGGPRSRRGRRRLRGPLAGACRCSPACRPRARFEDERRRNTAEGLAASLERGRHRQPGPAVGPPRRARRCPCWSWPGERRRALRRHRGPMAAAIGPNAARGARARAPATRPPRAARAFVDGPGCSTGCARPSDGRESRAASGQQRAEHRAGPGRWRPAPGSGRAPGRRRGPRHRTPGQRRRAARAATRRRARAQRRPPAGPPANAATSSADVEDRGSGGRPDARPACACPTRCRPGCRAGC